MLVQSKPPLSIRYRLGRFRFPIAGGAVLAPPDSVFAFVHGSGYAHAVRTPLRRLDCRFGHSVRILQATDDQAGTCSRMRLRRALNAPPMLRIGRGYSRVLQGKHALRAQPSHSLAARLLRRNRDAPRLRVGVPSLVPLISAIRNTPGVFSRTNARIERSGFRQGTLNYLTFHFPRLIYLRTPWERSARAARQARPTPRWNQ